MFMKILITGGGGYIGGNLIGALIGEFPQSEVVVVLHDKKSCFQKNFSPNITFLSGDILDTKFISEATKGVDVVYHLAALKGEHLPYDILYRVNVLGTKNILDAAIRNGIKRVIFASTIGVLGEVLDGIPLSEEQRYNPFTKYEKTKYEAEVLALDYMKKYKLALTVLRPTMVYGPDSHEWCFFLKLIRHGLPMIGSGDNYFHLVHVDDVVQSLVLALKKSNSIGNVYNIADDKAFKLKDFYCFVYDIFGMKSCPCVLNEKVAAGIAKVLNIFTRITKNKLVVDDSYIFRLVRNRIVNIAKAKRELEYAPHFDLQNGLKGSFGKLINEGRGG